MTAATPTTQFPHAVLYQDHRGGEAPRERKICTNYGSRFATHFGFERRAAPGVRVASIDVQRPDFLIGVKPVRARNVKFGERTMPLLVCC